MSLRWHLDTVRPVRSRGLHVREEYRLPPRCHTRPPPSTPSRYLSRAASGWVPTRSSPQLRSRYSTEIDRRSSLTRSPAVTYVGNMQASGHYEAVDEICPVEQLNRGHQCARSKRSCGSFLEWPNSQGRPSRRGCDCCPPTNGRSDCVEEATGEAWPLRHAPAVGAVSRLPGT